MNFDAVITVNVSVATVEFYLFSKLQRVIKKLIPARHRATLHDRRTQRPPFIPSSVPVIRIYERTRLEIFIRPLLYDRFILNT